MYIPADLVRKSEISVSAFLKQEYDHAKLQEAVYNMACIAHSHLEHSRDIMKDVPKEAKPSLMITFWLDAYLNQLEKVNFDVFHPSLEKQSGLALQYNLTKGYFKGVY